MDQPRSSESALERNVRALILLFFGPVVVIVPLMVLNMFPGNSWIPVFGIAALATLSYGAVKMGPPDDYPE
ncbi:hypothetical protein [Halosolutus halophilus]|uniref:hypothetical protein n=1 Tax=Halosolutus halophilus TaxID=1552990 RepID=UPI00223526CE|nr:hypothetical protein [Halosolutus halophilus]